MELDKIYQVLYFTDSTSLVCEQFRADMYDLEHEFRHKYPDKNFSFVEYDVDSNRTMAELYPIQTLPYCVLIIDEFDAEINESYATEFSRLDGANINQQFKKSFKRFVEL
jgi:hypothetical protein